jgi:Acyl-CoA dehydrogenases
MRAAAGVFGPDSVRAERAPGGWRLYGHRWYVLAAHAADVVVVPAMTESGPAMFLADPRSLDAPSPASWAWT